MNFLSSLLGGPAPPAPPGGGSARRLSGLGLSLRGLARGDSQRRGMSLSRGDSSSNMNEADAADLAGRARAVSQQYEIGETASEREKIWVLRGSDGRWEQAGVAAVSKDGLRVTAILKDNTVETFLREGVRGVDPSHGDAAVGDLGRINDLSEPAALAVLELRFMAQCEHTTFGPMLISLNPYHRHDQPVLSQLSERVFNDMKGGLPQSILVNGESGSGKTEVTKALLRHTNANRGDGGHAEVRRAVAQTTPLLEAFGNALTQHNPNSSRFGKWTELFFDKHNDFAVRGSTVATYLLETSRVVATGEGERNFHVFYQLSQGLDQKSRARLFVKPDIRQHAYLKASRALTPDECDQNAAAFLVTSSGLEAIGLSPEEKTGVFECLALILALGDVTFSENAPSASNSAITASGHVEECLAVLTAGGASTVSLAEFQKVLTHRAIVVGKAKEVTEIALTLAEARDSRDNIAKALYSRLFSWLVQRINAFTTPPPGVVDLHRIGVLDLMGFELQQQHSSMAVPGFEQLLINYASERLQAEFNELLLKNERDTYQSEGVDVSKLDIPRSDVVAMFSSVIFPTLDEMTSLNATDEAWLKAAVAKKHADMTLDPFAPPGTCGFVVRHFSGAVSYSALGFVVKNRGGIFHNAEVMFGKGTSFVARALFPPSTSTSTTSTSGPGKLAMFAASTSKRFSESLEGLMATIKTTRAHFVRCVRPNRESKPLVFDQVYVSSQLLRLGVMEAIRLRREGFSIRMPFAEVVSRYPSLLQESGKATGASSERDKAEAILVEGLGQDRRGRTWALGKTMTFLGSRALIMLDREVMRRQLEKERRAEEERLRRQREAQELERLRLERLRLEAELAAEEERQRKLREEERLRKLREEELARRKAEEEAEAKRALEEKRKRFYGAAKLQAVCRGFRARRLFQRMLKERREFRAAQRIQKHVRGHETRKRFLTLRSLRQPFVKMLRRGELVLKSSLVVRVRAHEMLRAFDEVVGGQGKVVKGVKKASTITKVDLFSQRTRLDLLLTRQKGGPPTLLLVNPDKGEIVEEMTWANPSVNGIIRAISTSNKDFIVAQGGKEWVLSDQMSGATSWVQMIKIAKEDGSGIPTLREYFNVSSKIMHAFEAANDVAHEGIVVRQGTLYLKRNAGENLHGKGGGLGRRASGGMALFGKGSSAMGVGGSGGGVGSETTWVKIWAVLTDSRLFWGKSRSAKPLGTFVFTPDTVVRVAERGQEKVPFVLVLVQTNLAAPVPGAAGGSSAASEMRFQCQSQADFDAWLVAFGVAVSRAKEHAVEERVRLGAHLHETAVGNPVAGLPPSGKKSSSAGLAAATPHTTPLVREVWSNADSSATTAAAAVTVASSHGVATTTTSAPSASGKGKKFDAAAFKKAFKDADKVVLANWE